MDDIHIRLPASETAGRARGGLFMGVFGGLWWFAGLQLQHTTTLWPYALDGLLTLALVGACIQLRRQAATAWIIWHQRGWLADRTGADRQHIRQP